MHVLGKSLRYPWAQGACFGHLKCSAGQQSVSVCSDVFVDHSRLIMCLQNSPYPAHPAVSQDQVWFTQHYAIMSKFSAELQEGVKSIHH